MEQVVLCLNITTSWVYDAATASSKTEGESKFIQEIIKNDYLSIGAIIFTADFNSYGQPYPLLQELKATTINNATATKVIFLEILVFMIYILKLNV